MTETLPVAQSPELSDGQVGFEIGHAAEILGINVETLRKRLQRGRMAGFKGSDGTWRVVLDPETAATVASSGSRKQAATMAQIVERLDTLTIKIDDIVERLNVLTEKANDAEDRLAVLPSLLLTVQNMSMAASDEPSIQEQLKPVMMALLEVLQQIKAR